MHPILARLPQLLAWQRQAADGGVDHLDLHPTPIATKVGQEGVHLRFLAGVRTGRTAGRPAARNRKRRRCDGARAGTGAPARRPRLFGARAASRSHSRRCAALQQGRAAQRDIGAQLFASNAIRRLRASVGEPSAVISAHRCVGAPGGGELRLSLSSPFDPRRARRLSLSVVCRRSRRRRGENARRPDARLPRHRRRRSWACTPIAIRRLV